MTDNEEAAIAAGLWEPGQICCGPWHIPPIQLCKHGDDGIHVIPAPDMRDPANLWRALENRPEIIRWMTGMVNLKECALAGLVELYDMEHGE